MTLRDIFDKDPRSKEELRKKLQQQGEQAADLASQIQQLKAEAATREKVLADLLGQNQRLKSEASIQEKVISDNLARGDLDRREMLHVVEDCPRRLKFDPPCRSNIDPGRVAAD